jgi:hypothetical protein
MPQWLSLLLLFAGYIVLMKWVLPRLGIATCISGSCGVRSRPEKSVLTGENRSRSDDREGR